MAENKNIRELSRQQWKADGSLESINAGSLQRIADATERMAQNYTNLQNECERYKRYYAEEKNCTARLNKSNAALRGHIKRLKNKLNPPTNVR